MCKALLILPALSRRETALGFALFLFVLSVLLEFSYLWDSVVCLKQCGIYEHSYCLDVLAGNALLQH